MKVAIQTAMRDSYAPYLLEWLNYHHSVGVDYFFLYDNESIIPLTESIKNIPFKENIFVAPIAGTPSPVCNISKNSYLAFLKAIQNKLLPKCDRVAFVDEDEFIVCENKDIKKTLAPYAEFSGIGINWRLFGSSGIKKRTPAPQMQKFIYYAPDCPANIHIKSIVNPYLVGQILNPPLFFLY